MQRSDLWRQVVWLVRSCSCALTLIYVCYDTDIFIRAAPTKANKIDELMPRVSEGGMGRRN